jgi:carotenoid 1,2-hydratase
VQHGGYQWWYLDAISDDGRHGLTIIAFVGSVFSPYYALARQRAHGLADPLNHCALNVALYTLDDGRKGTGWAMTERGHTAVKRSTVSLQVGPSSLQWDGSGLTVHIEEITVPFPSRLRGRVRLYPDALVDAAYPLDEAGLHQWCPIAPSARIEVDLDRPGLCWRGLGYLDSNRGERPLENDFRCWDWSRAALGARRSAVLYDVTRKDGSEMSLALAFDEKGRSRVFASPPSVALPATAWRVARHTRSDNPEAARVNRTLEDGPFYARSVLQTHLLGEPALAVHESLSLQRWRSPVVQMMLPFRMPRRSGRTGA